MTIKGTLQWATGELKKAGLDSSALDAEVLLAHVLKKDRAWLYGHGEMVLSASALTRCKKLITRRTRREPVAYILGHKEFYGLDFTVNRNVLVPRPETELLVELAIRECRMQNAECRNLSVVDVGTGSGAIAVAVARHIVGWGLVPRRGEGRAPTLRNGLQFFATDISREALKVARVNARRHGVEKRITFLRGNLFAPLLRSTSYLLRTQHLIITANLPYLPTSKWRATMPEVKKWEPRTALDGGQDGLKYYQELFWQLKQYVPCSMFHVPCFCEICLHQFPAFKKLVRTYFTKAKFCVIKDLAGRNRVVVVQLK